MKRKRIRQLMGFLGAVLLFLWSVESAVAQPIFSREVLFLQLTSFLERALPPRWSARLLDRGAGSCGWNQSPPQEGNEPSAVTFEFGSLYVNEKSGPSVRLSSLNCWQADGAEIRFSFGVSRIRINRSLGGPFVASLESGSLSVAGAKLSLRVNPNGSQSDGFLLSSEGPVNLGLNRSEEGSLSVSLISGTLMISEIGESAVLSLSAAQGTRIIDFNKKSLVENGASGNLLPSGFFPGSPLRPVPPSAGNLTPATAPASSATVPSRR